MKRTIILMFILLVSSTKLFAGKSVDVGFYATAVKSTNILELVILNKKDVSEYQKFKNGKKRIVKYSYVYECKVLKSLSLEQENIILNFSVHSGIKYDDEGGVEMQAYYFNNHSGLEFRLEKGTKFIGLINGENLLRAEKMNYKKGLEMFNSAYMINDYLMETWNTNLSIASNQYYYNICYWSLVKNSKNDDLKKILFYDFRNKKFILIKKNKSDYVFSIPIEFNCKTDKLLIYFNKKKISIKTKESNYILRMKSLKICNI